LSLILGVVSYMYAMFAVLPFLTFAFIWFLVYFFLKEKKMTTRLTMDITTIFLIGTVSAMWNKLFHTSFGFWLIALVILVAYGLIGGFQTKEKGQTDLLKVTRVVWRLSFFGLSVLYLILFLLNVGKNYIFAT
jgi:hypothetical protein